MPLGGLIPYDDEEERRRRMMTPGINPNVARLPEASMPRALPRPATEIPGGDSMPPSPVEYSQPTRMQRMDAEKESFMRGTPGRGRSALTGALLNIAQGLGSGQGLAESVGQGIGGAIGGAINPKGVREQQFNRLKRPELMERFAAEDQEAQRVRQGEQDALNNEFRRAQIGAANRSNMPALPRPQAPIRSDRGLYDPEARGIIPGTEPLPQAPRQPAPNWVETDRGFVNLNDPKSDPTKIQRRREPKGGGRGGDRDTKARDRAVAEFNNAKQALVEAVARGDEDAAFDLRDKLNSMVTNIASRYGDQLEVGGGDWPYIKQRGGQPQGAARPTKSAKRKDPLGIR